MVLNPFQQASGLYLGVEPGSTGTTITKPLTVDDSVSVNGPLTVDGTTTLDGQTSITGTTSVVGSFSQGLTGGFNFAAPGSAVFCLQSGRYIEMGADSPGSAYIDFHSSGSTADYDSRIISVLGGSTAGVGAIGLDAAWTAINGDLFMTPGGKYANGAPVPRQFAVNQMIWTYEVPGAGNFIIPLTIKGWYNTYAWTNNGQWAWGQGFLSRTSNNTADYWWLLGAGGSSPLIDYETVGGTRIQVNNNTGRTMYVMVQGQIFPYGY